MELLKRLFLVAALCLVTRHSAEAASVPTPAPGTGTIVAAPAANNPVQYNFTPNTVISSAQVNSNSYKIYADLNSLISFLSSCSYYTGYDVANVISGTGITATLSGCNAVSAQNLTVGLSHGDYVTASPSSLQNVNINVAFTNSGYMQIGPAAATASNYITHGTNGTYAFVQTDYSGAEHFAHGNVNANTSGVVVTGLGFTNTATYDCTLGSYANGGIGSNYSRQSGNQITVFTNTSASLVAYICVGY